jgi:hypothetical protein
MEELHAPTALPPEKQPPYPVDRRLGASQSLDAVAKRKNPYLCRESNPGCPACSLVITD